MNNFRRAAWLLFLFSVYPLEGKSISFENLAHTETAQPYLEQEVGIRGFLYQDAEQGTWVLCSMPNLKSCCLHKKQSCPIYLLNFTFSGPADHAVEIQGTLKMIGPRFYLDNPKFVKNSNHNIYPVLLTLCGIGILCAGGIKLKHSKKKIN